MLPQSMNLHEPHAPRAHGLDLRLVVVVGALHLEGAIAEVDDLVLVATADAHGGGHERSSGSDWIASGGHDSLTLSLIAEDTMSRVRAYLLLIIFRRRVHY